MKNKLILMVVIGILCFTPLFAGGQQEIEKYLEKESVTVEKDVTLIVAESFTPFTVKDATGRDVRINKPVRRICFTHPYAGEVLKVLDAWDLVVGKDGTMTGLVLFQDIEELPAVSASMNIYDVNFEKIFDLDTDLLVSLQIPMPGREEIIERLEPDVPVFFLSTSDESFIETLGRILGREKEADEYVLWKKGILNFITERTGSLNDFEKPDLFIKMGWGPADLMVLTDDFPGAKEQHILAGAVNAAAELASSGGYVSSVDPEWLIARDPDIVASHHPAPGVTGYEVDDKSMIEELLKQIMEQPAFAGGKAAANKQFYFICNEFMASPRDIVFVSYLAKWCHPELFADFDPQAVHQEYLTRFMRIDYDLNEHGVFVYPEE